MKSRPWLRLYTDILDDEKLGLLAFEDRWHFIAILACKGRGLLDKDDHPDLMRRKIALKLGLATRELDEVARRLSEVGLIDRETLQPIAWDERQFLSDTSTDRVRAYRERKAQKGRNTSETFQERPKSTDTDTDTDTEKEENTAREPAGSHVMPVPDAPVEVDDPPARKAKRSPAVLAERPESVSESVWSDFKALREKKRAPLTKTALRGIEREAARAGVTLDQALERCCQRGWQGFEAEWLMGEPRGSPQGRNGRLSSPHTGFDDLDYGQGGDF